jgi:tRNA-dihydrouridine synthase B
LQLKIGKHIIDPGLALAPMAGITNHPFRILAKEQGCRLLYSEMISAKGLQHDNRRSRSLLYFTDQERPIGIQLFGSDPVAMARAASKIEALGADFIDLNFGCPTRKITCNREGGALMREPARCREIFRAVVGSVSCPVTVKLRKGWDEGSVNAVQIASIAEQSGIQAVTVHGRTVEQGYSGRADWDIIKAVTEKLSIPVIGNGDIVSPQSAREMLEYCRCAGIMVGRAARGNPWIFASIRAELENKPLPAAPSIEDIVEMVLRHFALLSELKGEAAAAREMRRHSAWYIRGLPGSASIRHRLIQSSGFSETEAILRELCDQSKQP